MRLGRALAAFRIPVAILRGPARPAREPITLVTAGAEPWVRFLTSRYFSSPPQREDVDRVAPWRLPAVLKRLGASADLAVALLDRAWSRPFFGRGFLVVPATLGSWGRVPDDPDRAVQANPQLESEMRRLRRNPLGAEVSHSEADFDAFYDSMYVPCMRSRHGEFAFIQPRRRLRRAFRHGGIVWVRRGPERIAGGVFEQQQDVLRLSASAIAGGDAASMRSGASAALYFHRIRHAHARGCTRIDFGGSPPILGDGLLRYKRKWGARLSADPESRSDYLLWWQRPNEHVLDFLAHTPVIFRHRHQLAAVTALDPASADEGRKAAETLRSSWMPGLRRLVVMVPRDLASGPRASLPASLQTRLGGEGCEVVSCEADRFLERYGCA